MAKIFCIANQKGGVGKSTTAHALGTGLHLKGYKVLLVDLDPQGNMTYTTAADTQRANAYDVLTGKATAAQAIQHTAQGDIIPSGRGLSRIDLELTATGKEYRLQEALRPLEGGYDYIVIDTPPALGLLTVNALTASRRVIVTAQADIFSLQGVGQLYETIEAVKRYCNPTLQLMGVLLTRHSGRAILTRDMAEMLEATAAELGTFVYKAVIRECVALKEAQASKQPIYTYAPKSNATTDYSAFVEEVLERSSEQ